MKKKYFTEPKVVSVPPDLDVSMLDTRSLCHEHFKLDRAIENRPDYCLGEGLSIAIAKATKCAVKTEIAKRAIAGDVVAVRYAKQRKWGEKVPVKLMAAE